MNSRCFRAALVAALVSGGCAQPPATNPPPWQPPALSGGDPAPSLTAPAAALPIETAAAPRPGGTLTLRRALVLALRHHPELRARPWELRAAGARTWQAGLGPNPELELELGNVAGSGDFAGTGALETTLSLARALPLGGDVQRRRELAGLQAELAGWDYEAARLQVLSEVTRHYVELLAAQRRVALAEEALALARQVHDATARRIRAGDAPPIDAARAAVPVATARVALRRAERQHQAARRRLALMWSSREPAFLAAGGDLDHLRPPPAPERLARLVNRNPEVARWAVEISARRAEARLARAEAEPDLTARAGLKYDKAAEDAALVLGISLPLALVDRRQGDVLAARLGADAAREQGRAAERRVAAALSEAYARMAAGFDEARALDELALPPAREAFVLTHRAFEQGDLALIDVLDAERSLVELRASHLDALTAYHLGVADIEALIGRPLVGIDEAAAPTTQRRGETR